MKEELLLNLEGQTNSKNKQKFLNVIFVDTFCIFQGKMRENGVCALNILFYILLTQLMQKINKKFSFT